MNAKLAMEYATKIERETIKNKTPLGAAFDAAYADYNFDRRCEMSIWDVDKPLEAMMLSHDHIAMLAVKHEKEIQELKRLVTPMMEFNQQMPTKIFGPNLVEILNAAGFYKKKEWVGLTGAEINHIFAANVGYPERMMQAAEALLKEKNNA